MNSSNSPEFPIESPFQHRPVDFRAILVVVWCLVTLFSTVAADKAIDLKSLPAPARLVVPKLHELIPVDGNLNEPVWTKAAAVSPFRQNEDSAREREKTVV